VKEPSSPKLSWKSLCYLHRGPSLTYTTSPFAVAPFGWTHLTFKIDKQCLNLLASGATCRFGIPKNFCLKIQVFLDREIMGFAWLQTGPWVVQSQNFPHLFFKVFVWRLQCWPALPWDSCQSFSVPWDMSILILTDLQSGENVERHKKMIRS
jgi:hypothetical protein